MTMGEALRQLDDLPFAFHVGKGRSKPREKLWAVALFREADGVANTDETAFVIEGDDLPYCVTRAVAWAETQNS